HLASIPNTKRFTPQDVVNTLPLGLIVDLTNTNRYYDRRDFTRKGVDHVKIAVPGKMVPPWRIVERFIDIVNGYRNDPYSSGKLIGVHCTHGLNRTGYLVCAYMILQLGYRPDEAISLFNSHRGHKMEHEYYLASLRDMQPRERSSDHRPPMHHNAPPELSRESWDPTIRRI
uniref:Uncharacterized protein n=1 Tax=Anopheles dirus TaxID=7168 RepID=A0A182N2B3_9DIPT